MLRKQRKCFGLASLDGALQYNAFAVYDKSDKEKVKHILHYLKLLNYKIMDYQQDVVLGEDIFHSWLNAISSSKCSLLFISKAFLKNGYCRFLKDAAIDRSINSKGKHRLIPVFFDNCCNSELRDFRCINALKFNLKNINMVWKLGKSLCQAISGCRLPCLKRKFRKWKVRKCQFRLPMKCAVFKSMSTPWQMLQVCRKAKHFILRCKYGRCKFQCDGLSAHLMVQHQMTCPYFPVMCKHSSCKVIHPRWKMRQHECTCQHRLEQCTNNGCRKHVKIKDLSKHLSMCARTLVLCPNRNCGCDVEIERRFIKDHLSSCMLGSRRHLQHSISNSTNQVTAVAEEENSITSMELQLKCQYCLESFPNQTIELHRDACRSIMVCSHCSIPFPRAYEMTHNKACKYSLENVNLCKNCNMPFCSIEGHTCTTGAESVPVSRSSSIDSSDSAIFGSASSSSIQDKVQTETCYGDLSLPSFNQMQSTSRKKSKPPDIDLSKFLEELVKDQKLTQKKKMEIEAEAENYHKKQFADDIHLESEAVLHFRYLLFSIDLHCPKLSVLIRQNMMKNDNLFYLTSKPSTKASGFNRIKQSIKKVFTRETADSSSATNLGLEQKRKIDHILISKPL